MNIEEIKGRITPVLRKHNIRRAGIFGSVATGENSSDSDVDLLVELGESISLLDFISIKLELEDLLETPVDLVEYQAIKPRLKSRILSEEIQIYG